MKKNQKTVLAYFQAKYLQVLKPFMAVGDIRFYLNGLQIKPHLEGCLITATDGHKLASVYDENGFCEDEIIVPVSADMFSFAKKKIKTEAFFLIKKASEQLEPKKRQYDEPPLQIIQQIVSTKILIGKKARAEVEFNAENPVPKMIAFTEHRELIHGTYPNWKTVIPDVSKLSPASNLFSFNAKYLADLDALNAARSIKDKYFGQILMAVSGDNPTKMIAVGGEKNECLAVIMAMRHDDDVVVYPEWLERKKQYQNGQKVLGWRFPHKPAKKKDKIHLWLQDGSSCSEGKLFNESACSSFKGANEFKENLSVPEDIYIEELNKISFEDDRCCKACLKAAKKLQDSIENVPWPSRKEIYQIQADQLFVDLK